MFADLLSGDTFLGVAPRFQQATLATAVGLSTREGLSVVVRIRLSGGFGSSTREGLSVIIKGRLSVGFGLCTRGSLSVIVKGRLSVHISLFLLLYCLIVVLNRHLSIQKNEE